MVECKLALEMLLFHLSAWVKNQRVDIVDINIQELPKSKKSAVCAEFPMGSKFYFLQFRTHFSNSLINSAIFGYGISHYTKFEMWITLFCVTCLFIFNSES